MNPSRKGSRNYMVKKLRLTNYILFKIKFLIAFKRIEGFIIIIIKSSIVN